MEALKFNPNCKRILIFSQKPVQHKGEWAADFVPILNQIPNPSQARKTEFCFKIQEKNYSDLNLNET